MGVDLSGLKETLTYKPVEFLDPASALPLKWYEAHPVVGNRILCFHFEAEDDNILHLVITGNTWLYRDDLERHFCWWSVVAEWCSQFKNAGMVSQDRDLGTGTSGSSKTSTLQTQNCANKFLAS